jgi:acetyl/propionyl-CoA carboxylase alpha subunit/acetyl-CoA carboxylase carboxyltransferase component
MLRKILIANRGEIALRIARAAADLGVGSVAFEARRPADFLDIAAVLQQARERGCDAVHPGYGFLSERADFAQACADAGLVFIGPTVAQLQCFGDKAAALALARQCGVPVLPGSDGAVTPAQAQAFFAQHSVAGVMLKAVAGGGGRGMRAVRYAADLSAAFTACAAEAQAAFGGQGVYVERLMPNARHIEVQVLGDGTQVMALGERECTLQRRFQKLVEIAPSPTLGAALRGQLVEAALTMARATGYRSLGTFEFLVDAGSADLPFAFIEANPRLQVEHTVTEQVTGLDLVALQIEVAAGCRLRELGLDPAAPPAPRGFAIQWRINAETLDATGRARPAAGTVTRLQWPAGPGLRIDTHAQAGLEQGTDYDSLLAKLVVQGARFDDALRRSQRALAECRIEGVATNLPLLRALAAWPAMASQALDTGYVEAHLAELVAASGGATAQAAPSPADAPDGAVAVVAPLAGRLAQQAVAPGEAVPAGAMLAVIEAMKMEHLLLAPTSGRVRAWQAEPGDVLAEGQAVLLFEPMADHKAAAVTLDNAAAADPQAVRPDLQRVRDRHAHTLDAARPEAIAARHARGGRTARENIADLCDAGSFNEFGALAVAAQTRRRTLDDLVRNTPADGMVTGTGRINGALFGAERSSAAVLAYDATVLAGTQGLRNHQKTDRLLGIALKNRLPVVLFAEGGGGRPGDVDMPIVAGLHVHTFARYAALSGQVPVVGIVHGRCFAGNAALLGCSDVIIATRHSNIGMGGPAMVEGGGLGVFRPEQIGPAAVQAANGVIDVLVDDEWAAVAAARRYLSFFQGALPGWDCADPNALRHAIPENRLRVYDIRAVMQGLFDSATVLELRAGFAPGLVTALARIEGRAVGVLANNPRHLGGAIDAAAADKAARFLQLCNAHGMPLVSLVDTPGFMVGPDTEAQAQVRHVARLFVTAAALRVPYFSVVLRKGYGLGAMGMTAGGFHAPDFTVAWPTAEFGAMGLEGAVRLAWKKELAALPEGAEREARYQQLVAQQYEAGSAINMAATLEIDAVIDPAETRAWLLRGLAASGRRDTGFEGLGRGRTRFIDSW